MKRVYALFAVALILLAAAPLAGCATAPTPPPEPLVVTKEVKVYVAQRCKALDELGDDPSYPDTDKALTTASGLFERVKLLLAGRAVRDARLQQYRAAKGSC